MKRLDDIHSAINKILVDFRTEFPRMDFFFSTKDCVFNIQRSLPGLRLSVNDDDGPGVLIESTWTPRADVPPIPAPRNRWDNVYQPQRTYSYLAHSFMGVPLVRHIQIFDYGFEVHSETGLNVKGVRSVCLADSSSAALTNMVGRRKPLRFRDDVDLGMKAYWQFSDRDEFAEELKSPPGIGQTKRKLILEEV